MPRDNRKPAWEDWNQAVQEAAAVNLIHEIVSLQPRATAPRHEIERRTRALRRRVKRFQDGKIYAETVGDLLWDLRQQKKLSQPALAELVGVADSTIRKWEYGDRIPSIDKQKKLAEVLEVEFDEIHKRMPRIKMQELQDRIDEEPVLGDVFLFLMRCSHEQAETIAKYVQEQ